MGEDLSDADKNDAGFDAGGAGGAGKAVDAVSGSPVRSATIGSALVPALVIFAIVAAVLAYFWWPKFMAAQKFFIQPASHPVIAFDSLVQDLGKVDEGIEVKCNFKVFNRGGAPLDIEDVKSSCGCTFPVWKRKRLMPGQSALLPVTVDTAMKQDKVEKTMDVISNDPDRGFVTLTIKLDVNDPHKDMGSGKAAKIFNDAKCMVCHVDQGLGLSGKELFEADCAMCHRTGVHGKAAVAPILEEMDLSSPAAGKMLTHIISRGSPHSRSMPGFLSDAGGPLDKAQISSLVKYLQVSKAKTEGKAHDH